MIWVASLLLVTFFGSSVFPHDSQVESTLGYFRSLANWDVGHFLGIAEFGYSEKYQYAFFPLYPIMISILTKFTQSYLLSGLLISFGCAFFAVQVLMNLVNLEFGKKLGEKVVLALLIFPTSFFLLTAYSESLFLLLALSSFYFLRKKNLFLAAVLAALCSATRLAGLAVVMALLVEVQLTQGISRKNWVVLLSPLGFLIYCWYLFTQTGDPFYFLEAEKHWLRVLAVPGVGFWETIKSLVVPGFFQTHVTAVFDLLFSILGVGLVIRSFRFLPISFSIYGLFSVLIPLLTPSLSSMPRFLLPIFPIFITIALLKNEYLFLAYQVVSLMLLSVFSVMFITGYWVS